LLLLDDVDLVQDELEQGARRGSAIRVRDRHSRAAPRGARVRAVVLSRITHQRSGAAPGARSRPHVDRRERSAAAALCVALQGTRFDFVRPPIDSRPGSRD
jgi:hypothetical protein